MRSTLRRSWRVLAVGLAIAGIAAAAPVAPSTTSTTSVPLPPATVAARQAFFGARNVNSSGQVRRDRVVLSWFGVSSLAMSIDGRVVLLDTYLNNEPGATCDGDAPPSSTSTVGYARAGYDQLVALDPEAIFIGHGHFDHECLTGTIAAATGAIVVALPQDCAIAQEQARRAAVPGDVACSTTVDAAAPYGTTADIQPLGPSIPVTVIRQPHSAPASTPASNSSGAESLVFRFRVGELSLLWHDTVGPAREQAPEVLTALGTFAPVDVDLAAVLGLGFREQGFRDAVDYAQAVDAQVLLPLHHDVGRGGGSAGFRAPLTAEIAGRPGLRTRLRWLQDPTDYLHPIVFNPRSPRWADSSTP